MSRVLTFSRTFPSYHPRKGQPTYFVEKIWKFLWDNEKSNYNPLNGYFQYYDAAFPTEYFDIKENIHQHTPKGHTIRAGHRWKVGDKFSPRVWSGKPRATKQITIAPDIEVKKVFDVNIEITGGIAFSFFIDRKNIPTDEVVRLAKNDGLEVNDFLNWFADHPKKKESVFTGQIICWDENINY